LDLEKITDDQAALLIKEHPKIMRRPLISDGRTLVIGFDPDQYDVMIS